MTNEESKEIVTFLDKAKPRFDNAPMGITFDKEKSYAVQILSNNEYLDKVARSAPLSLLSAMSNVASIGLSLNPAKKQAYLVPRGGIVCLDPSYMGMCDLAIQSGSLVLVQAKIVRENDTYVNRGIDKDPLHEYKAFGDRGEIVGAYCVAKTKDGDYLTTEMEKQKIDDVKNRSELGKKDKGPWVTDYEEMAKKTVVRNAFKMWPKTETLERLEMAVELSNQNEQFEPIISAPEIGQYTNEQKHFFDKLIENADSMGMFVFMTSLESGVQTSLYNSFEKGTITKYKRIVDELLNAGRSQINDIQTVIEESVESGDDLAVKELIEDLSQEVTDWLNNNLSSDAAGFMRSCLSDKAA